MSLSVLEQLGLQRPTPASASQQAVPSSQPNSTVHSANPFAHLSQQLSGVTTLSRDSATAEEALVKKASETVAVKRAPSRPARQESNPTITLAPNVVQNGTSISLFGGQLNINV